MEHGRVSNKSLSFRTNHMPVQVLYENTYKVSKVGTVRCRRVCLRKRVLIYRMCLNVCWGRARFGEPSRSFMESSGFEMDR